MTGLLPRSSAENALTIYKLYCRLSWHRGHATVGKPTDLVQGTLDILILKTLALESRHGWAIAKRIQQITNDVLKVQQGSLYPALYRLEKQGLIDASWAKTDTGREAKFYALTPGGRAHLETEITAWERLSGAVNLVIREAEG